jgi:hypothetical protein
MRRMFPRHVFNSRRGLRVINMPSLLARLQLSSRELNLHVQCGLLGARRRHVHGVRSRKVQESDRSSRMLVMFLRHVFNSRRGHSVFDMRRLFGRLQLSSRELGVHLQCWLLRA